MPRYLISTVETYRVDNEEDAAKFINEAKQERTYLLSKYTNEHKERKAKGEVIDEYYKVTLTKIFNDIKEADREIEIIYKD